QVEPARDDLPGRQRRRHAGPARPAAARVPHAAAAGRPAAGHRSRSAGVRRERPRRNPPAGFGHHPARASGLNARLRPEPGPGRYPCTSPSRDRPARRWPARALVPYSRGVRAEEPEEREEPEGVAGDTPIEWGSDAMAELLGRLDLRYLALVPGSSYRG